MSQAQADKLQRLLQLLEAELHSFSAADSAQQEALDQLRQDIDALKATLHGSAPQPSANRLGAFLEGLETEHPRLTLLLEQTIDTLAGMGI